MAPSALERSEKLPVVDGLEPELPGRRQNLRPAYRPAGFGRVEVSHVNLNDNVVEGLNALDIPAFSVQYHPEAAAGPRDANYLFDRFRELVIDHLHETARPATDQTESN